MLTRPNVLSNQILHLHTDIARGESRGGTYGVCGEKRTWRKVGYLLLAVNERDIGGGVQWEAGSSAEVPNLRAAKV